ncbi:MAG: hypothetical protein JO197_14150 [Acidobacteria bacterium]|nr:hypothetical protein [Acidobacteriota bacterium]MBV9478687.1 hypothetical protein [Acidobacteriota bacterium]
MVPIRSLCITAALSLAASVCLADATVEQHTTVHFGGVVGGIVNVFGGRAAREGVDSTTSVKGPRRLTVTGETGELVDLSAEKIYRLDYGRKTYKVVTFDELRKQLEDAKKRAAEQADDADDDKAKKKEGPEYEVDFDVRETGKKEKIGDYDTHEVLVTATVHEKGKKLAQSGGAVLTADLWMGPRIPALREVLAFNEKYFRQLYGDPSAEMQQMAVLMASTPTFAKAMKAFAAKRSSFEGDAVRTTLTFESVAAPGQEAKDEDSGGGGVVGGLLSRAMKKRNSGSGDAASAPGHSKLFESTTDVLRASTSASDVALPADFKQK